MGSVRWWARLALAGLRASLQRSLVRLLVLVVGGLAMVLVSVVVVRFGSWLALPYLEERVEQRWQNTLDAPQPLHYEYLSRAANSSAVEVERAAAAFGLDLVPMAVTGRSVSPAASDAGTVRDRVEVIQWCQQLIASSRDGALPVPGEVTETLSLRREALDRVVEVIVEARPPRWELDVDRGTAGRLPNLVGQLWLQRWLAVAVAERLAAGESGAAQHIMEAAWRLNQDNLERPETISRLTGFAVTELHLAILRTMPAAEPAWLERLERFDPAFDLGGLAYMEAHLARTTAAGDTICAGGGLWPRLLGALYRPLLHWMILTESEVVRRGVEGLSLHAVGDFDSDVCYARLRRQIPRWNPVAGEVLPNPWQAWPRAVRLGLDAELTAKVLRLRAMDDRQREVFAERLPPTEPSRLPGSSWEWTREDSSVRIRLVGVQPRPRLLPGARAFPLEYLVEVVR